MDLILKKMVHLEYVHEDDPHMIVMIMIQIHDSLQAHIIPLHSRPSEITTDINWHLVLVVMPHSLLVVVNLLLARHDDCFCLIT